MPRSLLGRQAKPFSEQVDHHPLMVVGIRSGSSVTFSCRLLPVFSTRVRGRFRRSIPSSPSSNFVPKSDCSNEGAQAITAYPFRPRLNTTNACRQVQQRSRRIHVLVGALESISNVIEANEPRLHSLDAKLGVHRFSAQHNCP
jgi:hypothetical protein